MGEAIAARYRFGNDPGEARHDKTNIGDKNDTEIRSPK
jgi:hypothetical protein